MQINRNPLHSVGTTNRRFLTLWESNFDFKGKPRKHWSVAKGEDYPSAKDKKPDAVMVVAFLDNGDEKRLVCTIEYRVVIGAPEFGFVAGHIEEADYEGGASMRQAAERAAIREMKEETGLDFTPTEVSPPNLYSSAGMTNESVTFVIGTATGTPSTDHLEDTEDIQTLLLTRKELEELMKNGPEDLQHSRSSWPYLHMLVKHGF